MKIETLTHDETVIDAVEFPNDEELVPHKYAAAAVEKAKAILHADGFAGKNVRIMNGEQLVWKSYYR